MRFLIREQDFETPIASGRFRLELAGNPTGDYETWRLTEIANDYRFLRVDQDLRGTGTNQGVLYHMLLNPEGAPERLKIRVLSMEEPLLADILFDEDRISATGERSGQQFEHELQPSENHRFYFSSALGLSLLLRDSQMEGLISSVFFEIETGSLMSEKAIRIQKSHREVIDVGLRQVDARPYLIEWPGKKVHIWLDPYNLPLKLEFEDGRAALDTQFMRYPNQASA